MSERTDYSERPRTPHTGDITPMDICPVPWMWVNIWSVGDHWLGAGIVGCNSKGLIFHPHDGEPEDAWYWDSPPDEVEYWSMHESQKHSKELYKEALHANSALQAEVDRLRGGIDETINNINFVHDDKWWAKEVTRQLAALKESS